MKLRPSSAIVILTLTLALTTGCNKKAANPPNYSNAINAYYEAHPACLWADADTNSSSNSNSNERRFPIQSAPDDAKTAGYDALVDAGLLTRTVTEKKILIISKRENNYDLSANGRSAWTADPNQPGFGSFCYGHRTVSSIDSASPNSGQPGATTTVGYHFVVSGVPAWAAAPETQTAFPQIGTATSTPQPATATLTDTANGWQVTGAGSSAQSSTPADGKIVQ